jgi:hypothetical protein
MQTMPEPITIERQIAAVRKEIGMRHRVFPRWVSAGKMTQQQADDGIAAMQATLETVRDEQQAKVAPGLF